MQLVDLSHTLAHGTITYPGLPAPVITEHLSREASASIYAPGTTFQIAKIEMIANTGTYLDAPSHRHASGADLSALSLEQCANLDGVVIDAGDARSVDADFFRDVEVRGKAVLIRTGWSRHFGTPAYGNGHPFLTRDGAQHLAFAGAALVGIDSLNIDDTEDKARPAHTLLLGANIPVVEHLTNLEELPLKGFRFFAVPPKFRNVGTFPVRAFALVC
ncbi:MAG TPA: cyclase family protein [Thermoanaerobaculia bacterium]|nr:cyclase family protein [Thermoanaerobaculia bacterium]